MNGYSRSDSHAHAIDTSQASPQTLVAPESVDESWHYSPINVFQLDDGGGTGNTQKLNDLVARCMRSRGWNFAPQTTLRSTDPTIIGDLRRFRSSSGYGVSTRTDSQAAGNKAAYQAYYDGLSPEGQRQYSYDLGGGDIEGAPRQIAPHGCQPAAMKQLQTALPFYDPTVAPEIGKAIHRVLDSPEFASSSDAWRVCMQGRGYDMRSIDDPAKMARERFVALGPAPAAVALSTARTDEARMGSADFECQILSVIPVRHRLEMAEVEQLKAKFPQYSDRPSA